ncbi:electron transport protein SCO1/SenC [Oscillochloris trichoides DG-6]|uniref:Electron transport protein SCO1/SenC n=1 Tax=Oscillochloris trichoides DG-6 TaxID=765420 RepID=E1IGZ4_9CHLR|nr:electron transport protein SCO1/SenC [Oscillochloris trichoides DG-6]
MLAALMLLLTPHAVLAQGEHPDPQDAVAFEQRLDTQVPLDLPFVDEQGQSVRLGDYFSQHAVVLQLSYYECPMLCSLVRAGMLDALNQLSLNAGADFQFVNVSIDPQETPMMAANARAATLARYNRPGAETGMHFLTGTQDSIDRLADAVGFHYVYDETIDQYAHAAGIVVLTPAGKIARYFFGVNFNPSDLRLGIVESSDNRVGSLTDQLLLLCYHYDPQTGTYTGLVMTIVRTAGILTMLGIIAMIVILSRSAHTKRPRDLPLSDSLH